MVVCSTMKNPNNNKDDLVYGVRYSSVGSAMVTGNIVYEPSNMDLAMKLHYLRVVYFLEKQAIEGLSNVKLKEAIFAWLCYYYESCGRFRREENNGKPYIKCNDCGVRFVEAKSSITLEQWVNMDDTTSSQRLLVADNVLGPELTFSPLVFLQITSLKCGGLALGLSWAHVLGDAFSASNYMNTLAQFLKGIKPTSPPNYHKTPVHNKRPINSDDPQSLKEVGPFGDHWFMPLPCQMDTYSFLVGPKQLAQLQSKLSNNNPIPSPIQPFELISAVIWQAVARVSNGPEPNPINIIKKDASSPILDVMVLRNHQNVGLVKANFSVEAAQVEDLVAQIRDMFKDERDQIGKVVSRDPGGTDYIIYGTNLTLVNWEEADFYGFEVDGFSPRFVNCFVDGIGKEGVVLVLPSPNNCEGRIVTLILPKSYMVELKKVLNDWGLIE